MYFKKNILIFGSVKKQLGSKTGFRFLAGSGFNEYGSETLMAFSCRFFNTVLDDSHLVVRSSLAPLAKRPEGRLFLQLLDQLRFYTR